MTEQRQIEIRAELARRMGWDFIQKSSEMAYSGEGEWYTPDGQSYGDEPPGFCADATASRALVAWLAGQDATVWGEFSGMVINSGIPFEQQAYADWEMVTRAFALAPLEIIAIAAAKALGIETE